MEALVFCAGPVHPLYNYLIDIKTIDHAVREVLVPSLETACTLNPQASPAQVLRQAIGPMNERVQGHLRSIRLFLNPTFSMEIAMGDQSHALLRQRFEFAASHRLHIPSLSHEENLRLFGKCTWKNGHGHNYHVEPCITVALDPQGRHHLTLRTLESIVDECIIKPFDHKNLNLDTEQFADGCGLNPSVENIAKVFFGILAPVVSQRCPGASLREITVWESDRTSSTYPA